MQQWIQIRLAASIGVAAGISPLFLDQGIAKINQQIFKSRSSNPIPSHLELLLAIEEAISEAIVSSDPIWKPLAHYVSHKERRKRDLTLYLAQLFERYGLCAKEAAKDWENNPSNWQEALWTKVFSRWDYPQRAFENLQAKEKISSKLSVHLFAFSHISPLHFHLFQTVGKYVPVYLYHLSPCQEFWSDLSHDDPSLLGTFGKMGRAMARLIEESNTPTEENYIYFGKSVQLKQIQSDLLNLQPTQTCLNDSSIQIHSFSTHREEIAFLHQFLLDLIAKEGIEPKDVLVMAPNICPYTPYIQAFFEGSLDFQIADVPAQKELPAFNGLFLLLNLEKKRWSAPAVLELFDHALFRKKWNFSQDDLHLIGLWVRKTGIRWGMNGTHRGNLLDQSELALDEGGTWMEGLGTLIEELAIPLEHPRIDFSQAELLGNVVTLLEALFKEMGELKKEKTLLEWSEYLRKLIHTYFDMGEDSRQLFLLLEKMGKAGKLFSQKTYSFFFVETLLQECVRGESVTINRNQLQAVRFCSMLPMRAIPSKIIYLLGMNHDTFPRKEQLLSLDLLKDHPRCGYSPNRIDFDRSLFLEALLSAREKLIISYHGKDPLDFSEKPPSSVISHLLPVISPSQIYHHTIQESLNCTIKRLDWDLKTSTIPQSENVEITTQDLAHFSRSFLSHYIRTHGLQLYEEGTLRDEETFLLTPSRKAILSGAALATKESIFKRIKREGDFPIGSFGKLAEMQIQEEIDSLPKESLSEVVLEPFSLSMHSSLTIHFKGAMRGVFASGLCISGKKDFRTAAKAWPLFVLLNAYDSTKRELLFAASDEVKTCFFADPTHHLKNIVELFLCAAAHPLLIAVEWIEPILNQDVKKLKQAVHYDPILQWYMRGKAKMDPQSWIAAYYPLLKQVYGEMANAWF